MEIYNCTVADFYQIKEEIADFWGSDRTLYLHHPFLIHEFGDTSFVVKDENGKIAAYFFGFFSQTEKTAYVHLIGVRESNQRQGLGHLLYDHYIKIARKNGCNRMKAITKPINKMSIKFHMKLGMKLSGNPNEEGIPIVKDYCGIGEDRVVFEMEI